MKVKGTKAFIFGLAVFLFCGFLPTSSFAQDVDVYGEAAWTDSDVAVYIYADINGSAPGPICSFGVKLTHSPDLTPDTANTGTDKTTWSLGSHDYTDVYDEGDAVVLIGGKLDPSDPTAGVSGERILLGKVTFTHSGATMPPSPPLALALGKSGLYSNFVCTDVDSTVLDVGGVNFGAIAINERGDANADGNVTPADMLAVRNTYYAGAALGNETAADCNGDGSVTPADMICIRNKYYNP